MVDYVIRSVRREPYPTDRLIMRIFGRILPASITPNQITWVRFILMPLVVYFLLRGYYVSGLVLFLVLAFSDALDGAVARTRKKITQWGIIYDPIADKLLIGSAVIVLAVSRLGLGLAFVIIGLEVLTIVGGLYFKFFKKVIVPANIWGKAKMCFQVGAITLLIVDAIVGAPIFAILAFWVFIVASGFAFISLLHHGA